MRIRAIHDFTAGIAASGAPNCSRSMTWPMVSARAASPAPRSTAASSSDASAVASRCPSPAPVCAATRCSGRSAVTPRRASPRTIAPASARDPPDPPADSGTDTRVQPRSSTVERSRSCPASLRSTSSRVPPATFPASSTSSCASGSARRGCGVAFDRSRGSSSFATMPSSTSSAPPRIPNAGDAHSACWMRPASFSPGVGTRRRAMSMSPFSNPLPMNFEAAASRIGASPASSAAAMRRYMWRSAESSATTCPRSRSAPSSVRRPGAASTSGTSTHVDRARSGPPRSKLSCSITCFQPSPSVPMSRSRGMNTSV